MEDVNVNVASELGQFKDQYNRTTKSLIANIIASLNKKFLGKGVRIMGKKNNPNIVVDNDYELLVKSINLEQVKNTFFLTFIDENGDSFYVNTKYQVVVLDRAPAPKSKQSNEKTNVNAQPSPQVQEPSPAEPAASNQQPAGDLSKQIKT
jgi:hypothetical protein